MEEIFIHNEIKINAPVSEVWDVLVNPEKTKLYMFGCTVISDWKIGSPVLWQGAEDGVTYVKGILVHFEKEKIFSFTTFDPSDNLEDIPENYLTATYILSADGNSTHLKVSQGNYATVANGAERYDDTLAQGGWGAVLEGIKKILEG